MLWPCRAGSHKFLCNVEIIIIFIKQITSHLLVLSIVIDYTVLLLGWTRYTSVLCNPSYMLAPITESFVTFLKYLAKLITPVKGCCDISADICICVCCQFVIKNAIYVLPYKGGLAHYFMFTSYRALSRTDFCGIWLVELLLRRKMNYTYEVPLASLTMQLPLVMHSTTCNFRLALASLTS